MNTEDKELLLKDLCARLPYNVKLDCKWKTPGPNGTYCMIIKMNSFVLDQIYHTDDTDVPFNEVKPYLFPLSSMTEEQKEEWRGIRWSKLPWDELDWLNKGHWDYRHLIEKGLAIDATGLNIY